MRTVIQRVSQSDVKIADRAKAQIGKGLTILLGITHDDTEEDVAWMANKVANLRIFADEEGKMNRSIVDIGGEILVISQFTLYGNCKKGNRPSFIRSAPPSTAIPLYQAFCERLRQKALPVYTGEFGEQMMVGLINDGPVTIIIDSKQKEI